ncbi:MAG TPA: molybdate ABC transporter substrate-binding protein [Pseudolabrys sp.]|nr:molybdate ABC transporter substrate-binding protein [Pseudolabrys sp.]
MTRMIGRFAAIATLFLLQTALAGAAEIKVFSTSGVKSVLEELIPQFEKQTGNKLDVTWSTAALLTKRVQAGEQADALILIENNVSTLLKEGKIAPGTETLFAKSIFAVGVKAGTPKPDISTPDALKKTLLDARAISYSDPASGGASGVYIAKQIERMGITDQLKDKTKFAPAGSFSGALLPSGEADIAIQSKPELLSVPGVEVVGPLPGDMAFTVVYQAGVQSGAANAEAAKALVKFLASPEAQAVFKAKGFDPA